MVSSSSSIGRKILIVSDAWKQINGVVTTLENIISTLKHQYDIKVLSHDDCEITAQMPLYPEVTLGWIKKSTMRKWCNWADYVHIATPEGPVGYRMIRYCVKNRIPFTTGYHTKWPEFIRARLPVPEFITYRFMKWLHKYSHCVLVPTQSALAELKRKGFHNLKVWTRGVNRNLFNPDNRHGLETCGHPVMLCVSRISKEKGLDDFCQLEWPERHTKMVVGDGPYLPELKQKYPDVVFTGALRGAELAAAYASADVFVFPSRSDTFGVVMLESMASGTPVAAYPVTGPVDVIFPGVTGSMDNNLQTAVEQCLTLDRAAVVQYSNKWTWDECAKQFLETLVHK